MPALATIIVAGVVYHLAQKASGTASPWLMLAIAYAAGLALALVLAATQGSSVRWQPAAREWIAGLLLGLAAFGIEAGFFYVYRSGWPLASASVITNISVTSVLALVGIFVFKEQLSATRAWGLLFFAVGATLLARR